MKLFTKLLKCSLLLSSILLSACSATNLLWMNVTEPAPVTVPANIKSVGIIDRSVATDKTDKLDKIDKVLSIEGKNLDKDGAKEAVTGAYDELKSIDKFTDVKIIQDESVKSPGMGVLPAPLSWVTVQNICQKNQVDALFVLSLYDTDTKVDYKAVPVELNGPLGVKVPAVESHCTVYTKIKTGWRIYDVGNKIILDEYMMNDNVVSKGVGINPAKAIQAITGRKQAVLTSSNNIGQNYAYRIVPVRIRVYRDYFVRGTDNFKIAKRRAQTGDWKGAADLWYKEISNPKAKVAGRSYYNMAIYNEINGDLDAAIDWASKSYSDFKNKQALHYLNILKDRQYNLNLLKQQQNQDKQRNQH